MLWLIASWLLANIFENLIKEYKILKKKNFLKNFPIYIWYLNKWKAAVIEWKAQILVWYCSGSGIICF